MPVDRRACSGIPPRSRQPTVACLRFREHSKAERKVLRFDELESTHESRSRMGSSQRTWRRRAPGVRIRARAILCVVVGLVTGGAVGIGRAIALTLLAEGMDTWLADVQIPEGPEGRFVRLDV